MLKQQAMADRPKHIPLSRWKRLVLIVGMLLPGGSLIMLVPTQAAYAETGWPQTIFLCRAGNGGNGGVADHESSGANGSAGGDCTNGPRGGDGAAGGQNASTGGPGGPGGNMLS